MILEVCVADPQSLAAAVEGGADRIELCSALELGGLTPLAGMMALAKAAGVPAYAMVRPRSGDFVFDRRDVDAMLHDIDAIRAAGLAGVVIGANRRDGTLDVPLLERLVTHAEGLGTTLHRAIDLVPDIAEATEVAVSLGVERILTSGGAPTALDGLEQIALAHASARGRVKVMAGSGLRPDNVGELLAAVPVEEVHSSCAGQGTASAESAVRLGFAPKLRRRVTDADVVRAFRERISG
ncbi:MAG TPA: copper homeostasis protein CutC [Devosia sp.]